MSNVCSELMKAITVEKNMIGDSSGSRMRKNSVRAPAPSMRAASITDGEMFCRPARKMMMLRPSDDQIDTMQTAMNARCGSPSQSGGGTWKMFAMKPLMHAVLAEQLLPDHRDGDATR